MFTSVTSYPLRSGMVPFLLVVCHDTLAHPTWLVSNAALLIAFVRSVQSPNFWRLWPQEFEVAERSDLLSRKNSSFA
jgi:hypothetical protein